LFPEWLSNRVFEGVLEYGAGDCRYKGVKEPAAGFDAGVVAFNKEVDREAAPGSSN